MTTLQADLQVLKDTTEAYKLLVEQANCNHAFLFDHNASGPLQCELCGLEMDF